MLRGGADVNHLDNHRLLGVPTLDLQLFLGLAGVACC